MQAQDADFICLQETKAQEHQLPLEAAAVAHYTGVFVDAERKGYSGVAIYARREPERIMRGFGWPEYDREGRWVQLDYGSLSIISFYMVSGSMGPARGRPFVHYRGRLQRCGHISGFLPHERAWMEGVLSDLGWVDAFRVANPEPKQFTWWSNFQNAFDRNHGWRIDYQLITPDLRDRVRSARVYRDQRFSDHAPVIIDYDVTY